MVWYRSLAPSSSGTSASPRKTVSPATEGTVWCEYCEAEVAVGLYRCEETIRPCIWAGVRRRQELAIAKPGVGPPASWRVAGTPNGVVMGWVMDWAGIGLAWRAEAHGLMVEVEPWVPWETDAGKSVDGRAGWEGAKGSWRCAEWRDGLEEKAASNVSLASVLRSPDEPLSERSGWSQPASENYFSLGSVCKVQAECQPRHASSGPARDLPFAASASWGPPPPPPRRRTRAGRACRWPRG